MSSPLKRLLKYFAIVVGLLLIAGAALILPAFVGRRGLADGVEVQGLRIVKDGIVSIGVIPLARSQVALIDAGNDKTGKAILAELSRRQLSPDAVRAIFLTHSGPSGGSERLPKRDPSVVVFVFSRSERRLSV
jgi:glyoxylase-like metal-dependent hydrolase (beta-lactamase superfamily II)